MVALLPDTDYEDLETSGSAVHRDATDRRHPFGSVEEIFAAVENKGTEEVGDTLKNLRHMLPTCLDVAPRRMERRIGQASFGDAMTMEYGMSQAFMGENREWNRGMKGGDVVYGARSGTVMLARNLGLDHQKLFDISSISFGQCRSRNWPLSGRAPENPGVAKSLGTARRGRKRSVSHDVRQ